MIELTDNSRTQSPNKTSEKIRRRLDRQSKKKARITEIFEKDPENARILIHVGKCGGKSLKKALMKSEWQDKVVDVHGFTPPYQSHYKYWILIRNPMNRAVSAFRWRWRRIMDEGSVPGNTAEQSLFERFDNINGVAECLYDALGVPDNELIDLLAGVGHIKTNIAYYIDDLLDNCNPNQIKNVMLQENLASESEKLIGESLGYRFNDNGKSDWRQSLTCRGQENLRRFLKPDYIALSKLYSIGAIDKNKIEILFD